MFECEFGIFKEFKVKMLCELGVICLSFGVENFIDVIFSENGCVYLLGEIYMVWEWIKEVDFLNVNIDFIVGMVGEIWDNWKDNIC